MAAPKTKGGHKTDKLWRDALMLAVKREDEDKRVYLAVIAEKCVLAAAGGDMAAIKEIGDRLDGKAVQATTISGPDGEPIPVGVKVSYVDSGSK